MPEEILILDKKAKEVFQNTIEMTLTQVIGRMHIFLTELQKIGDPDYNQQFYEELLSLAEEGQRIQGKLYENKNVTLREFIDFTNHLTHANETLKKYNFGSGKEKILRSQGAVRVFPEAIIEEKNRENNPMVDVHEAIQESMQKVVQEIGKAAEIINEHHSTPKQKIVLKALLEACSALAKTWQEKFKSNLKKEGGLFAGLQGAVTVGRSSFFKTLQEHTPSTLKRKASEMINESEIKKKAEALSEDVGKRSSLVTGFQAELQRKVQEMKENRANKQSKKPPSPSP